MSLVIAIKDDNRFVLGADKQGTIGNSKSHTSTKIWDVKNFKGALMGGVGICRANQVIQYYPSLIDKNDFPEEVDFNEEYIVTVLAPTLHAILKTAGMETSIEEESYSMVCLPNLFLFAYKDKAWTISNDMTVEEVEDYIAIGSGAEIAKGVLYATKDLNPFERITMAIDAAAFETTTVDESIDILTTEERENDCIEMCNAFGIPWDSCDDVEINSDEKENQNQD